MKLHNVVQSVVTKARTCKTGFFFCACKQSGWMPFVTPPLTHDASYLTAVVENRFDGKVQRLHHCATAASLTDQMSRLLTRPVNCISVAFRQTQHLHLFRYYTIYCQNSRFPSFLNYWSPDRPYCLDVSKCGSVAEWLRYWTCDQQVAGSNPGLRAAECNPGQVVYTHVPLSPSSIIWYQPMGGDALRLGR